MQDMINSYTKWLQFHEVTCYFGAIRKTWATLISKFSCFRVQYFSLEGKRVSSDTENYKSRPHTISSLLILNYALALQYINENLPAEKS